jgi:uncharacterized protein
MRLTLDTPAGINLVTHLGPDGIRVGEQTLARSFVVSAAELHAEWGVSDPKQVSLESLAPALALAPEILVLGTGARIAFPESRVFAALAERGIGLEVMDTAAACRTYNVLVGEERPVVAALILP